MEESSGLASAPVRQILSTCTVDVEMWPNSVVVSIVGELDMADGDQVGKILIDAAEARKPIIRLELAGLTFADSSAIKAILMGAQAAEERAVVRTGQPARPGEATAGSYWSVQCVDDRRRCRLRRRGPNSL